VSKTMRYYSSVYALAACLIAVCFLTLIGVNPASAQDDPAQTVPIVPDNYAKWVGERIDYHVAFGIVPAGKAQIAVLDTEKLENVRVVHARTTARSAKAFDIVFRVRDTIDTWFDRDSLYAVHFRKKLNEGPYHHEDIVDYDQSAGLVRRTENGKSKPDMKVEPRVQDVLSAGFKARTLPLAVGDTFYIKTHDVDKTYDLMAIVHARENVETLAGTFDCFKVEPVLKSGGLFKKEKGAKVFVWVTTDDRRIPVQMQSRVSFGAITATMEAYTPPTGTP
jgi:hypothetical protein